jgi:hypothetical protein
MATIKIHNAETGEVIERDMTADELAQWELDKSEAATSKQDRLENAAAKAAAEAKLEALGLTTEDLRALGL